ncbi:substrate-binding domain-containing protein [Bacillus sp. FJAT-26390]|uniref:substrate-binding domain-containing protein n=1 Tax=Bacillus sp. FJAT-26390 TaxID=1743142 RepID=UPI000807A53E|nr:substrate-binding domain-containing protein [Bacillus sp. FJAT-26390]OBZ07818.1 sugar ABC transporter substrate-binding protein [Bacillus sp. FJAT-26390]
MRKRKFAMVACVLVCSLALAACGVSNGVVNDATGTASEAKNAPSDKTEGNVASSSETSGPITINQALEDKEILSKGPDGENAVSAKMLILTEAELAQIKEGQYTAAISMHYAGNDWSAAQLQGLRNTFASMNIKIVATTDANFKAETQVANIETILAKKPNILVSIPVDAVSTASVFKKAAEQGVKLVFMDNKASGLQAGKDYVSVVSADNYGNGVEAAHILAKAIGEEGEIGVIYHEADFFVTKQRTEAFEKTIQEQYPNINIVDRGGISGPNDGEKVAAALLTKHPKMKGLFVVWDVPAEGALAAARSAGREDLAISTIDLGTNVALDIAKGGMIKGLGAQLPYDQGVAEAILAAYALLGKEAPAYVAVPSLQVNKDNILESWKTVYHADAPASIQNIAK